MNIIDETIKLLSKYEETITKRNSVIITDEQNEFFKNSKIRDNEGNLLVVYHGTDKDFTIFDKTKIKTGSAGGDGFYFTPNKNDAGGYAGSKGIVYSCFLNITNPFIYEYGETFYNNTIIPLYKEAQSKGITFEEYLQNKGYDGIILTNYSKEDIYIAFEPNQIKSIYNKCPTNSDNINETKSLNEKFDLEYGDYERPPYNDGALQRAIDNNTPKEDYYGSVNIDAFCKGYPACGFVIEDLDNAYDYDGGRSLREWKYYLNKAEFGELPTRVTIYRAVPKSVKDNKIHNGDWVAITYQYAQMHAEGRYTDGYKILRAETTTDKLWFDGNNICEFGLDDTPIRWK